MGLRIATATPYWADLERHQMALTSGANRLCGAFWAHYEVRSLSFSFGTGLIRPQLARRNPSRLYSIHPFLRYTLKATAPHSNPARHDGSAFPTGGPLCQSQSL
jgi:hypothetical protein